MTIRNERNIKDLFTDNGGLDDEYTLHKDIYVYTLCDTRRFT